MQGTDELLPPLLLTLPAGDESEKQYFYNLLENRHQTTSFPILCGRRVVGSSYGWLVLVDPLNGDCCLWNPTSLEVIDLLAELEDPPAYNRCFLSKPPTEPGCFIVFNQQLSEKQCVYEIGDDGYLECSDIDSNEIGYRILAMASFRGVVYGIVHPGYAFVALDFNGDGDFGMRKLLIDGEHPLQVPQPTRTWAAVNLHYLMESPCGNELLLVTKMCFSLYLTSGMQFRVFRVDVGKMECEELDNLDGRTIFINHYGNGFCRRSSDESTTYGAAGIKANSIYYTNRKGTLVYVYDLDDKSTVTLQPCTDADIDPNTNSVNYWVDLPDIPTS